MRPAVSCEEIGIILRGDPIMIVGKTDTGKIRQMNQDVFCHGELGEFSCYAVVCDGMGGEKAGNVASRMACDIICNRIQSGYRDGVSQNSIRDLLITAVTAANAEVYNSAKSNPEFEGMGTTTVAALVEKSTLHIAHVGDSRAYVISKNEFTQVTRDHSLVQELLEQGKISDEDAKKHPQRNLITRAVGVNSKVCIDYLETALNPGDRVLICTDGLTNNCDAADIYKTVLQHPPGEVPERLIDLANAAGGPDNITVVLLTE